MSAAAPFSSLLSSSLFDDSADAADVTDAGHLHPPQWKRNHFKEIANRPVQSIGKHQTERCPENRIPMPGMSKMLRIPITKLFLFSLIVFFFFLGLVIGFNPALLGRPDARDAGDARDADHFAAAVVAVVVAVVFCCFFSGYLFFFFLGDVLTTFPKWSRGTLLL